MKRLLIIALACLCFAGCSVAQNSAVYSVHAHCEIITEDGNIWDYDGVVLFDNNGTPDNIYDDIIVGLGK